MDENEDEDDSFERDFNDLSNFALKNGTTASGNWNENNDSEVEIVSMSPADESMWFNISMQSDVSIHSPKQKSMMFSKVKDGKELKVSLGK